MAWVKLDDGFSEHPKMQAVGPLGMATQVAALCYSNRNLTDGFIPHAMAKKLVDLDEIRGVAWRGVVRRLVDAGAWREVEGGWQIHDYEQYQPTRAQVVDERRAARERMQAVRANRKRTSQEQPRTSGNPEPVPDVPTERTRAHARDPTPKPTSTPQPPTFNGRVHPAPLEEASDPHTTQQQLDAIRAQHIQGPNP